MTKFNKQHHIPTTRLNIQQQ